MTEAGQILALVRSASAAELAKRFNQVEDGVSPLALTQGSAGTAGRPDPRAGLGASLAPGAPLPGAIQPGPVAGGAVAGPPASSAASDAAGLAATAAALAAVDLSETQSLQRTAGLRAAASLAHLAPPRSDLVRLLADAALSGLPGRTVHAGGDAGSASSPARLAAATGLVLAYGVGPAEGGVAPLRTAAGLSLAGTAASGSHGLMSAPSVGQPMPAVAESALRGGMAATLSDGAVRTGTLARGGAAATQSAPAADGVHNGGLSATGPAQAEARGTSSMLVAGASTIAFAETMATLMDAANAGRGGASVASGIIFNAAMIPGWPFPSAFARDGVEMINQKAVLHRLAATVEGMTPQEAAEYMAKIGGGYVLLRNLRRILRELDMLDKEDVKGLLFAFLETLSSIAVGVERAFRQLAESAAVQEAVVHGEDPQEGGNSARRRLRL